jgi:hypothetical protein
LSEDKKAAAKTVKVELAKPIVAHGGAVSHVVLREPTVAEYLEIGDPFLVALSPEGKVPFIVEDKAALASYVKLLVVEPDWLLTEKQLDWRDMRKIMERVRSFFQGGAEAGEGSGT